MTSRHAHLAVLLRKAEWMISDAAFAAGGNRLSSGDREELAESLTELAGALREEIPKVVDCDP